MLYPVLSSIERDEEHMKTTLVSLLALLISTTAFAQDYVPTDNTLVDAAVPDTTGIPLEITPAPTDESTSQAVQEPVVAPEVTPVVIEQPLPTIVVVKQPVVGTVKINGGTVVPVKHERNKYIGLTWGLGLPTGMLLGLSIRPAIQWAHLDVYATSLGIINGVAGSVTLDPINFGIAPTITGEMGRMFPGKIPGKDVKVSYDHASLLGGIEFGSRRSFRFYIRGGVTWMNVKVQGLQSLLPSNNETDVTFSDPLLKLRLCPTGRLGFDLYF
jgi:hypothetical protein